MKVYKDVLTALLQDATPTAKQNKFIKFYVTAQDPILKELCKRVADMYGNYLKSGWTRRLGEDKAHLRGIIPTNHQEWVTMQSRVNAELREYVEARLAEGKPEWMVTAEKHGWRPPM